ncbi:MAG TPA: class I SAM-dependent methyltransferase [Candidatus Eisenbacteria bacterium]|nr:class I SAM-dependent methyltransferase [Candidatus Eisenbacteria bacterium]
MSEAKSRASEPNDEVRYDRIAEGYARHWGPVIRPMAEAVLDLAPLLEAGSARLLDIGTGTGTVALAALERWSHVVATGIDPSSAMLDIARREAKQRLPLTGRARLRLEVAPADRLPFRAGTFDVVVSSFVLQLVPSRAAALREARRVLRRGGEIAWVTWLAGGSGFRGDEVVDEVLDEFGFDPPEPDSRSGDVGSVGSAATATRQAGFRGVRAVPAELEHRWDAPSYTAFISQFDEESLFAGLEADEHKRIEARLLERLSRLSPEELTYRLPVVSVTGRAP